MEIGGQRDLEACLAAVLICATSHTVRRSGGGFGTEVVMVKASKAYWTLFRAEATWRAIF